MRRLTEAEPLSSMKTRISPFESAVVVPSAERGYRKLFLQEVLQADQGVDFDFLRARPSR